MPGKGKIFSDVSRHRCEEVEIDLRYIRQIFLERFTKFLRVEQINPFFQLHQSI